MTIASSAKRAGGQELLRFLGFSDVIQLKPRMKGLEKRYYNGTRVTFIGRRTQAICSLATARVL